MRRWNVTGLYKAQRDGRGATRRLRSNPVARLIKPEEHRVEICPKCHLDKADPIHLIKCEGW